MRVHLWVPELHRTRGGIQEFSKHLVEAVIEHSGEAQVGVFSKNDLPSKPERAPWLRAETGAVLPQLRTLVFALRCLFAVIRERPALIISTHLHFAPLAVLFKQLFGIPFYVVAHGVEAWNVERALVRKSLPAASLILCVSETTRERLLAATFLSRDKMRILYNTFAQERFQLEDPSNALRTVLGLSPQTKVLLTVGRLDSGERYKGHAEIIAALPSLLRQGYELSYIIVGSGDDYSRLCKLTKELGLTETVRFVGTVSETELPSYYQLADLFLMPSAGEGFGIVYLEALASGKPVLAGVSDAAAEVLLGETYGALASELSPEPLAKQIGQLLAGRHPASNRTAEERREYAVSRFGNEAFQSAVNAILSEHLEQKP